MKAKQEITSKHNNFIAKIKPLIKRAKKLRVDAESITRRAEAMWSVAHQSKIASSETKNLALSNYDRTNNLMKDIDAYCDKLATTTGTVRITIDIDLHIDQSVKSFNMAIKRAMRSGIIYGRIHGYSQPGPYETPDIKELNAELKVLIDRFKEQQKALA